jgi:hypothetical protein
MIKSLRRFCILLARKSVFNLVRTIPELWIFGLLTGTDLVWTIKWSWVLINNGLIINTGRTKNLNSSALVDTCLIPLTLTTDLIYECDLLVSLILALPIDKFLQIRISHFGRTCPYLRSLHETVLSASELAFNVYFLRRSHFPWLQKWLL